MDLIRKLVLIIYHFVFSLRKVVEHKTLSPMYIGESVLLTESSSDRLYVIN